MEPSEEVFKEKNGEKSEIKKKKKKEKGRKHLF